MAKSNHGCKELENAIKSFEPIPFYFLNDDIDRAEILLQLDFMQKNGISAYFLHVRDGITNQAFGTDFFFENIKFIVTESIRRGIKVWLYDEDAYPSGNCGGMTVINHPELQAMELCVKKVAVGNDGVARLSIDNGIGVCGYVITQYEGQERVETHLNCFGTVRKTWYKRKLNKHYFADMQDMPFEHYRGSTCYSEAMFELAADASAEVYCVYKKPITTDNRYGTVANTLDRRTAEYFIERVHKQYQKHLGEYFGNEIPGIFMDEPSTGGKCYCEELNNYFEKRFGYSPMAHFYKLSPEYTGESAAFRRDYATAISELFRKNFLEPLRDWCHSVGLIFTGHFAGEESLSSHAHGNDIYRAIQLMDLPGIDLIGNDLGDMSHLSLLLGGKIISSAAWQNGKDTIMCEAFALNPFNFGYRGMKLNADWLYANGVNLIVPHGFFYAYNAFHRGDAGKSFFFQDPLFPEYQQFSVYAARVGRLLHEYRADNRLLVVLPLSACSEEELTYHQNTPPTPSKRMQEMLDTVYGITRVLCARHVGWDITYTDSALEGELKDESLVIGEKEYANVVVVAGGEKENELFRKLNGRVNRVHLCNSARSLEVVDSVVTRLEGDTENLLLLKKCAKKERLYFFFNNSRNYVKFTLNGEENLFVYDAEADEYLAVKGNTFALNGYESLILVTKKSKCEKDYEIPAAHEVALYYKDNPEIHYLPVGGKRAIVDFDLHVAEKTGEKVYKNVGFSRLRDVLGTVDEIYRNKYMIPYFDTAPRIQAPYPVSAKFVARFERLNGGILFDKATVEGEYQLYFNGKLIPKESLVKKRIYDASNVIFYPEWRDGENTLEIVFADGKEFDGVNGEFFVMEEGV